MSSYEKLIVVHNPSSTAAERVERRVFNPLDSEGVSFEKIATPSPFAEDLIELFNEKSVSSHDRILVAGGDGTLNLAVNAIIKAQINRVQLGVMAFGNSNDGARVSGRFKRDAIAMSNPSRRQEDFYPLRYKLNSETGDEESYAFGFVSLGQPVYDLAGLLNNPEFRKRVIAAKPMFRVALSAMMIRDYLKENIPQMEAQTLPEGLTVNGSEVKENISDILALNGPSMATVFRNNGKIWRDSREFHRVDVQPNIPRTLAQVAALNLGLTGRGVDRLKISFPSPTTSHLQADGELAVYEHLTSVIIDKIDQPLNIITT